MYYHDTDQYLWEDVKRISTKRLPTNSVRDRPFYSNILFPSSSYQYNASAFGVEALYPQVPTQRYGTFVGVASIELEDGRSFLIVAEDGEAPHCVIEMSSYRLALHILNNLSFWFDQSL